MLLDIKEKQVADDKEGHTELFKHLNDMNVGLGQSFFRSCILINGGASVAILGFVASVARADDSFQGMIAGVADALMFFAWGIMFSVGGIAASYLMGTMAIAVLNARSARAVRGLRLANTAFHLVAIAAAVLAAISFLRGAWAVKAAVTAGFS